jgi:hypothetical protein
MIYRERTQIVTALRSVPGAIATGSDWSATVSVAVTLEKAFASEDACAPVAAAVCCKNQWIAGLVTRSLPLPVLTVCRRA